VHDEQDRSLEKRQQDEIRSNLELYTVIRTGKVFQGKQNTLMVAATIRIHVNFVGHVGILRNPEVNQRFSRP
jgi:hypothetical protein